VWEEELVPLLQRAPALTPITLLEHLQRQKPDVDWIPLQRTLQRRVREWKALHAPDPEVMFPLSYEPGEIAFCDFTQLKGVEVSIAGEVFPHLLFHYRLAWSGWSYVQVVQGGESFVALSEGLQNALAACGGVPGELRTDRLSAACRNRNGSFSADITRRYHALCSHYGLAYSRNNCGVAHENGRVESPHGHLKRRIEQALLLRGSSDFETLADYQAFLSEVGDDYNRPRLGRLEQEKAALRPLPPFRFADYDIEQLTVRRTSTIEVRRVVYSVPPRLIGQRLTVRIFQDRLQLLLGRTLTCELERLHGGVELSGDSENWSGGDTKTGPPRGASQTGRQRQSRHAISGADGSGDGGADPSGRGGDATALGSRLGPAANRQGTGLLARDGAQVLAAGWLAALREALPQHGSRWPKGVAAAAVSGPPRQCRCGAAGAGH
jgi:transposase InsO family protein